MSLKCIETNKHKSKRQKIRTKHEYKQINSEGTKRLIKCKIKHKINKLQFKRATQWKIEGFTI